MARHNDLGRKGEEVAISYLLEKGYAIHHKNWTHEKFEIDIIASDEEYIIFVEVKTRTSSQWGNPEEAVSDRKIKRIIEAADFYLKEYNIEKPARFDIIAIISNGTNIDIEHFEDAFLPPVN